jgi:hypothetical protein
MKKKESSESEGEEIKKPVAPVKKAQPVKVVEESKDSDDEPAVVEQEGFNQDREDEKKRNRERLEEIKRKRELAAKEKEETT